VHDVGYLEAGLVGSFDMLVMSDEINRHGEAHRTRGWSTTSTSPSV